MLNLTLLSMMLIPVLVYWLSRRPVPKNNDVLTDYIVPQDVDVRTCATHWGVPAGVTRVNHALLREITCHPDYVERNVPDAWFKWTPADARRRTRARNTHDQMHGVLSIRKQA